jgi:hypothetical protein
VWKLPSLLKLLSNGGPLFSCSWTLDHLSSKLGFDGIVDLINDEGDSIYNGSELKEGLESLNNIFNLPEERSLPGDNVPVPYYIVGDNAGMTFWFWSSKSIRLLWVAGYLSLMGL